MTKLLSPYFRSGRQDEHNEAQHAEAKDENAQHAEIEHIVDIQEACVRQILLARGEWADTCQIASECWIQLNELRGRTVKR